MSDFRDHLEKSLSNPAFKAEWENQSVERDIMRQIVEARIAEGLSQQELAAKCGMKPSNLCRLENHSAFMTHISLNVTKLFDISFLPIR